MELGLAALARELEHVIGVPPANVLWWRAELREVILELERPQPSRGEGRGPR